ncbi:ankyrin repeat domain-containing protein [Aquimarina sp. 2201CG14-23]|uniref:ankyrin repeat domain-containing protein n=1 Tax=Aquimarina mycalae TaxID=3040073 RepID=UPI00247816FC|nr:ankyrin repeat domain-containing protein [Aquimarina sp. 2201CG14-23]MDH7445068.1 ankyrin repeat domain-containing protein [Aquimarina sp. 2201CG14-23]
MKKTIVTALAIMFITSVSFATEKSTTLDSHNYEISTNQVSTFCMAIVKGETDTVKKMIELGSDVNKKSEGMTPLMYAARYNRVDIIKMLVKKGAKVKARDSKGNTAMKFAKLSNAKEAMAVLKKLS